MSNFVDRRPGELATRSPFGRGQGEIQTPRQSDLGVISGFKAMRAVRKDDADAFVQLNRITRAYQLDAADYHLSVMNEQIKRKIGEAWADERTKSSQKVGKAAMDNLRQLSNIEQSAMDIVSQEAAAFARRIDDSLASGTISERQANQQKYLLERREESIRGLTTNLFDDLNRDAIAFAKRTVLGPTGTNNEA